MTRQPCAPPVRCFAGLLSGQQKTRDDENLERLKIKRLLEIFENFILRLLEIFENFCSKIDFFKRIG